MAVVPVAPCSGFYFIFPVAYAISINNGEIKPGEAIEMLYLGESGWKAGATNTTEGFYVLSKSHGCCMVVLVFLCTIFKCRFLVFLLAV